MKPINVSISVERPPKTVSSSVLAGSNHYHQSRLTVSHHQLKEKHHQHHQLLATDKTPIKNANNNNIELVQLNELILIKCTVSGSRPPANITWYNKTEELANEPNNEQIELSNDATYR